MTLEIPQALSTALSDAGWRVMDHDGDEGVVIAPKPPRFGRFKEPYIPVLYITRDALRADSGVEFWAQQISGAKTK